MLIYWFSDYMRKLALALVVTLTPNAFFVHIFTLMMTIVAMLVVNGYVTGARSSRLDQRMDAFNEVKLMLVAYHLFFFTDYLPDPELKYKVGYSCLVFLALGLFSNMFLLVVMPIIKLRRWASLKFHKRTARREMQTKKEFFFAAYFYQRCIAKKRKFKLKQKMEAVRLLKRRLERERELQLLRQTEALRQRKLIQQKQEEELRRQDHNRLRKQR